MILRYIRKAFGVHPYHLNTLTTALMSMSFSFLVALSNVSAIVMPPPMTVCDYEVGMKQSIDRRLDELYSDPLCRWFSWCAENLEELKHLRDSLTEQIKTVCSPSYGTPKLDQN